MGTNMHAGNMGGGASNQSSMAGNMTSGNMTSGNDPAPHAAEMTADKTLAFKWSCFLAKQLRISIDVGSLFFFIRCNVCEYQ